VMRAQMNKEILSFRDELKEASRVRLKARTHAHGAHTHTHTRAHQRVRRRGDAHTHSAQEQLEHARTHICTLPLACDVSHACALLTSARRAARDV
jgi:hypothetical protein